MGKLGSSEQDRLKNCSAEEEWFWMNTHVRREHRIGNQKFAFN
jgi:hypothetical protein